MFTPRLPWIPMRTLLMTTLCLGALACTPDDVKGDDSGWSSEDGGTDGTSGTGDGADGGSDGADGTDGTDGGGGDDGLVGDWRSEGEDLCPLFRNAFFDYKLVDSTFNADGTYSGYVETNDGQTQDLQGTYTIDEGTSPATISLSQTFPEAIESQGIWEINGDTLTYEIVTVNPDQGCTPPTPSGGFGSTSCPGLSSGDLIQIYRRQ